MVRADEKVRLLLLFGGRSCEHEVSVTSAKSVLAAVDRARYDLALVGIGKSGRWMLCDDPTAVFAAGFVGDDAGLPVTLDYSDGGRLVSLADPDFARDVDVVFPLLHGPHGEDGTVQGLLELAGVAYVGSPVAGSAVSMDKELMRRVFAAEGLTQTAWRTVSGSAWRADRDGLATRVVEELGLPLFVKPCNMGSSVGVSKVHSVAELGDAVDSALRYDLKAMVEASVEGAREIECAVLGNDHPEASPLGEIVPGAEFYNYETKYIDDKSQLIVPAPLEEPVAAEVRAMSVAAFRAVGALGLARVDFLVHREAPRVLVNEINTMPGFTPISMYPKLWQHAGISYGALIDRLVDLARARRTEVAGLATSR